MEVYINDMLVKSLRAEDDVEHLRKTFDILEKISNETKSNKMHF